MEFEAFPKIPRLRRPVTITEKIDGTNAAIVIGEDGTVAAQSRKRLIIPGDDNYGFAAWVQQHQDRLVEILGPGRHFGEWWGVGIQRGYGLRERRFSLFNVKRWNPSLPGLPGVSVEYGIDREIGLYVVPKLHYAEQFSTADIERTLEVLRVAGSRAASGYDRPEGIVVYHHAGNHLYKVLLENDELPKGLAA